MNCLKVRLSSLYFLQFGVWGCYLTCFGQFLGAGGIGSEISWFYAAIGIVSIFTPWLFGRLADRAPYPERLLASCHLAAALVMLVMWWYGMTHQHLEFRVIYPLYILFLAFYMPTMALANIVTFGLLTTHGRSTVTSFPSIRVWGTVGFVAAMWFVNTAYWHDGMIGFTFSDSGELGHLRFQYNAMQLLCSGVMGFATAIYSYLLPSFKSSGRGVGSDFEKSSASDLKASSVKAKRSWVSSVKMMFGQREICIFLIFVVLSGVCLQISNGFVTPFITHFIGLSEYADSLASGNATMLFSLSQISEAFCILLVGMMLKKGGIKTVYAIGLFAWGLRFLMLGLGNPGNGLWLLIGSMLVYGVAFNFITIAGHLHIQQVAPSDIKGFAQGLMMLMSNGIGATTGIIAAGAVVNKWCHWDMIKLPGSGVSVGLFMGDWIYPWFIFAGYAFLVMLLWMAFKRR